MWQIDPGLAHPPLVVDGFLPAPSATTQCLPSGLSGRYFDAASVRDLESASRAIDRIEKGFLTNKAYLRDSPVYQWFALPALVCLGLTIALKAVPYFIDRT